MKVFFDTSTLAKRYVLEEGTAELNALLLETDIIVVAPIFLVEFFSLAHRRVRKREIKPEQYVEIKAQIHDDIASFEHVTWDNRLLEISLALVEKYPLASLDSIHLASALMFQPDLFVTSDTDLYKHAKQELKYVRLI